VPRYVVRWYCWDVAASLSVIVDARTAAHAGTDAAARLRELTKGRSRALRWVSDPQVIERVSCLMRDCLAHRRARRRPAARRLPILPNGASAAIPAPEVGRPAAPGAAPPGRPSHSTPCTARDWRDFWGA